MGRTANNSVIAIVYPFHHQKEPPPLLAACPALLSTSRLNLDVSRLSCRCPFPALYAPSRYYVAVIAVAVEVVMVNKVRIYQVRA